MCGIYGSINKFNEIDVLSKIKKTSFRGPDFTGVRKIGNASYFAHNRLSIIDLDPRSNQPFAYKHLEIVFNGEIYNFQDIKSSLVALGHNFFTVSDTEVICVAYLEYGEKCLDYFNGMFSFVIYDAKKNLLFGARDRLGVKPFFYIHDENKSCFEFASQLSPLIYKNNLSINWDNVAEYFFWGYNQKSNTPFYEVKKLSAGNFFIYNIGTNDLKLKPFWDIGVTNSSNKRIDNFIDYNDAKFQLNDLLIDSVKLRMISDVPLGVFLSGGVDSSLIAAISQKVSNQQVKTFSITFSESKYDESKYSRLVAQYLGTQHNEYCCEYTEVKELISNFEDYFDEPFADMSSIPTMLLSKRTKEKVTVALSGDGADEVFAGYERYRWMKQVEPLYNYSPKFFRNFLGACINKFPSYKLKLISEGIKENNLFDLYCNMVGTLKKNILSIEPNLIHKNVSSYWDFNKNNLINKLCDFDINTYLINDINTKVDRASMRFSLEARAPFMDYRVIEFARSLPVEFKFGNKNSKLILKDILYDFIPKEYFQRPKAGFGMPFKEWFRTDLKSMVFDYLTEDNLNEIPILNNNEVFKLVQEHMDGKGNHSLEIWKIIVWIKFYKKFKEQC